MTGGMNKYWIIPRVGNKKLSCVGHQLASCSFLIFYVFMDVIDPLTSLSNSPISIMNSKTLGT